MLKKLSSQSKDDLVTALSSLTKDELTSLIGSRLKKEELVSITDGSDEVKRLSDAFEALDDRLDRLAAEFGVSDSPAPALAPVGAAGT